MCLGYGLRDPTKGIVSVSAGHRAKIHILMKTETIHFDHGPSFELAIRLISGAFGVTGIVSILTGSALAILVGLIILTCALYAITTKSGVIIDREKKLLREYVSYYGIKGGKWVSLQKFPHLVILRAQKNPPLFHKGKAPEREDVYKLYLMNKSHYTRVPLKTFDSQEEAMELAAQLSRELGLEVRKFNPQRLVKRKG